MRLNSLIFEGFHPQNVLILLFSVQHKKYKKNNVNLYIKHLKEI